MNDTTGSVVQSKARRSKDVQQNKGNYAPGEKPEKGKNE